MKRKLISFILVCSLLMIMTGCSSIYEREYIDIQPHIEQEESDIGTYLTASTYTEIKDCIMQFIRQAADEGTIRVSTNYSGSLVRDVPQAIYEVMQEEPLAAYAVEYIPNEAPVQYLNYYEVHLDISYRVSQNEIENVISTDGLTEFSNLIGEALENFEEKLVVECNYYDEELYDIGKLMEEELMDNPKIAITVPEWSLVTYPQSGTERILEVSFSYGSDLMDEMGKRRTLEIKKDEIVNDVFSLETIELLRSVSEWAKENITYDADGDTEYADSPYGALCLGNGNSRGIAMAGELISESCGIPAMVVSGTVNDETYYWTLVEIDGKWAHWDLAGIIQGGEILLQNDEMMAVSATWKAGSFPASSNFEPVMLQENPVTAETTVEE